jgi:hypothetical protein
MPPAAKLRPAEPFPMPTEVFRSAILPHGIRIVILGFGLLRVASFSPAITEGDAPRPTATAPAVSTNLTTLDANGFRVALAATGFRKDLGYEKFHGNYFRLAQFHTDKEHEPEMGGGFTFSLLVDDLPRGVKELKELFTYAIMANKLTDLVKDGRLKAIRSYPASNGILYRYPQQIPVPKEMPGPDREFRQWQWYFQSIQNGKWFEVHFSRGVPPDAPVPEGIEPVIDRILRSLQFPAAPAR